MSIPELSFQGLYDMAVAGGGGGGGGGGSGGSLGVESANSNTLPTDTTWSVITPSFPGAQYTLQSIVTNGTTKYVTNIGTYGAELIVTNSNNALLSTHSISKGTTHMFQSYGGNWYRYRKTTT